MLCVRSFLLLYCSRKSSLIIEVLFLDDTVENTLRENTRMIRKCTWKIRSLTSKIQYQYVRGIYIWRPHLERVVQNKHKRNKISLICM